MASITIRNLDESLKSRLRIRAAHRHRSMEDEVGHILWAALAQEPVESTNLGEAIQRRFQVVGGVELTVAKRAPIRKPPRVGA
ncbi:MAG: plasmid stabilization protein [Steroidobacteraceae bacterium]